MIIINGTVTGQRLALDRTVVATGITIGQLKLSFSPEWDGYVKVAVFFKDKDKPYRTLFNDNGVANIPSEVANETGTCFIGVFGTLDNKVITTEAIGYNFRMGAITKDLLVPDPTPDIYTQLLSAYNTLGGAITDERLKAAVDLYIDEHPDSTKGATDEQAAQISQNTSDISQLKSDLGELKDVTNALLSNNLLNPNKVKTNTEIKQTTGEESQNNGYSVTDFMEVTEGLKYVYASTQAFSFLRICYYSSKNTYINGITLNVYEREHIIEIPSGVKLIRLMVRGNITQDCWFGESETTDYLYSVYGYCGNNAVEKSTVKIDYALYNTDNMYDSSDNRNAKGKIINWNRMNIRGCVYTETFEDNASYHVSMPIPVKYRKTYYMYGNNAGKYVRLQCRRWYMLDKDLKILGRVLEADNVTIDNPYVSFIVFNNELAYKNDIVITDNQNQDDVQDNNLYQKRLSDDTGYLMSKKTAFDWTGKNICGYGDSITQYGFWIPIVAKWFGFSKYYNYGLSGSHVGDWDADSDWWVGSKNFKVYGSTASIAEKPANDAVVVNGSFSKQSRIDCIPSDTDVILIMGGTNDMPSGVPIGELKFGIDYDTTTFKGALAETVKRVQTKLPNAQVVLMTCIYNTKNDITPYNKAIKEVADELGLHCIDTHACGINRFNANEKLRDGTHPTYNDGKYTGSFMMASTIISGLQNIRPHYNDSYRYTAN